jgi:FkbM family methyltransferase
VKDRQRWLTEAAAFAPLVAVETEHGVYLVRTDDSNLGARLFTLRRRVEFDVIRRLVDTISSAYGADWITERTFVDVGANIGTSAIPALLAGFARCVAIEPEALNLQALRANLALNDLTARAVVIPAAASDHVGMTGLRIRAAASGKHSVTDERRGDVVVGTITIDSLVEGGALDVTTVGTVWIDVQGHEAAVLAGASSLIGTCPVVVEWVKKTDGGFRPEVIDRLLGYTHFADLRAGSALQPIAGLVPFVEEREPGVTDLLALNLP